MNSIYLFSILMPITIFLQARMSSKRLPGKVLLRIDGSTIIDHIIDRLKKIRFKKKIILLTSQNKSDDPIVKYCIRNNLSFFRGNLKNVYMRYCDAIKKYKIKKFVRINADSPLIDPKIIDKAVSIFQKKNFDLVTNCMIRTFPKGQSVEIINSKIFLNNFKNIKSKKHREHIFLYYYKNRNKFKIYNFKLKKSKNHLNQSIDTLKDYIKIKKFIEQKI